MRNPPKRCGTARSAPTGCDQRGNGEVIASAGSAQLRRVPPNHERIIDLQPPSAGFPFFRSRSGGNPPDDGRCARDLPKRGCKTKACFFRKVVPSGDFFVRIGQETFCLSGTNKKVDEMVLRKKMPPTKSPGQETTEVHQEQLRRCFDAGRRKRKSQEMGNLLLTEML